MIITDGTHLVSTESERELHEFADRVGFKRRWYQNHPTHPHYDITTPNALRRVLDAGAVMVQGKDIIKRAWWATKEVGNGE